MDDLTKAIDKLLTEKTFTVEAVRGIEDLRKRAERLEAELKSATDLRVNYQGKYEAANAENVLLKSREAAVVEREKKMTELEKTVAVEGAKSAVLDSCLSRVLQNRIIRESIITDQPVSYTPQGSSYPTTMYQQKRDNIERQEG